MEQRGVDLQRGGCSTRTLSTLGGRACCSRYVGSSCGMHRPPMVRGIGPWCAPVLMLLRSRMPYDPGPYA